MATAAQVSKQPRPLEAGAVLAPVELGTMPAAFRRRGDSARLLDFPRGFRSLRRIKAWSAEQTGQRERPRHRPRREGEKEPMNSDIKQMVKALEAEGWSIGTDGRVARTIERGSSTVEQVNASSPLARVTLAGKLRWVSVRDLVAFQHLGMPPANTILTSINGNPADTSVVNLEYRPRTGKQAEAANRAKKAQERAEVLAKRAEEAAQKAREAAQKAAVAAGSVGLAPPSAKRTGAAKQAA